MFARLLFDYVPLVIVTALDCTMCRVYAVRYTCTLCTLYVCITSVCVCVCALQLFCCFVYTWCACVRASEWVRFTIKIQYVDGLLCYGIICKMFFLSLFLCVSSAPSLAFRRLDCFSYFMHSNWHRCHWVCRFTIASSSSSHRFIPFFTHTMYCSRTHTAHELFT